MGAGQRSGDSRDFRAGAKEESKGAEVRMSNGQIHLIAEKTDDSADGPRSQTIFPIASISQAQASGGQFVRCRYYDDEVDNGCAGGGAAVKMAVVVIVPPAYTPIAPRGMNDRRPPRGAAAAPGPPPGPPRRTRPTAPWPRSPTRHHSAALPPTRSTARHHISRITVPKENAVHQRNYIATPHALRHSRKG